MKIKTIFLLGVVILLMSGCTLANFSPFKSATPAIETPLAAAPEETEAVLDPSLLSNQAVVSIVQETFQGIYNRVNPSVVNIQITQSNGFYEVNGQGSGFVWDKEGHIVTNNHVVENATSIVVVFSDGTTSKASLVGADPESDLAVIKVDPESMTLKPVVLGDSQDVQVGDLVIAIGNPYGLSGTMTQGIVSALSRSLAVDESNASTNSSYTIPDIIQTDTAINPGNSGGVLLNVAGEVIGVPSAIKSSTNSNSGIGFAIPSHIVNRIVPVLIADGKYNHPRMGISGITLTPSIADQVGLESSQQGVLIVNILRNGPADKAGLIGTTQEVTAPGKASVKGGDVILAVDGKTLRTYEDLITYIFNNTVVGQKVNLTILRDGKEKTVELTLDLLD